METLSPEACSFELPYPPSVNHYWRRVGRATLISREGRRFRSAVCAALAGGAAGRAPLTGRLAVHVMVCPPDRRRRDIDNVQKATFDALEHAGVYSDDAQIDRIVVERGPVVAGGRAIVRVEVIG
ncbi:MAG: RusA family crossover junction endodeoxyribonuclease [Phycisphaeraceae bacterium]|nr:RusA family crossover junction endodeoxyribonuclease [Phycisphaeraceae bacterium]